ncbi:MAG: Na+/H+ antiporter subunit E [bacterium]|nr:Na+/H+ antiporter subunit E [bacterium]
MTLLALHLALALLWAMSTGSLNLPNLLFGFFVAGGVLHFAGPALGDARYAVRVAKVVSLGLFFLRELLVSSVRVAIDVLRPELTMTPAVIAVPLDLHSDAQVTLLANLISLTPGTLSIDVATDRSCLYVHAMYGHDPEAVRRQIKHDFERRILGVFR